MFLATEMGVDGQVDAGESSGHHGEARGSSNRWRPTATDAAAFTPIPANGGDRDLVDLLK